MNTTIDMSFFTDKMVISIIKREMSYDNMLYRYLLHHQEKKKFTDYYEKIKVENEFTQIINQIMNEYFY